jgi:hypothetical protein
LQDKKRAQPKEIHRGVNETFLVRFVTSTNGCAQIKMTKILKIDFSLGSAEELNPQAPMPAALWQQYRP